MLKTINTPDILISRLSAQIPDYVIQQRDAGKGQKLDYISGATVIDILNTTFGYLGWNFEIIKQWKEESIPFFNKYNKDKSKEVTHNGVKGAWENQAPVAWVHGRLTIKLIDDSTGQIQEVVKEAFGSKSIIGKQSEQEHIFKAAQTDALKKAASLLGIGAQLYREDDEQLYYDIIKKPIIWTDELCKSSDVWKQLINLINDMYIDIPTINSYLTEYTEGSYVDIYTLPEDALIDFIDYLKSSISEEDGE